MAAVHSWEMIAFPLRWSLVGPKSYDLSSDTLAKELGFVVIIDMVRAPSTLHRHTNTGGRFEGFEPKVPALFA